MVGFIQAARTPRLRTFREWTEQSLIIPEGKYRGTLYRPETQPWSSLLLDEFDRGCYTRFAVTGTVQSGKTLIGFNVPILYYLFERKENVICVAPTIDIAADKWEMELLPVIMAGPYRRFVPRSGRGSRGGFAERIDFENGASLKFMSSGGGDEKRSGFTARIVVATEIDKMDTAGETSRETDPVRQIEARTSSWDLDEIRIYLECTTSIEEGRINQEYHAGTASEIICPCPHCKEWVSPGREHLQGWQDAADEKEAAEKSHYCCPECGEPFTGRQRLDMNIAGRLLHRGQTIDRAGVIHGDPPRTNTLGFRWNAFNNMLWSPGKPAVKEWSAINSVQVESDSAERELCQFIWTRPFQPPEFDATRLNELSLRHRTGGGYTRGIIPEDATVLTVGVDMHKWRGRWTAIAWRPDSSGHVVEYGEFNVLDNEDKDNEAAIEPAVVAALRAFRDDVIEPGFTVYGTDRKMLPNIVMIDARYKGNAVYSFCRESPERYLPAMGHGEGLQYVSRYSHPKQKTKVVKALGLDYYVSWDPTERLHVVHVDADAWKTRLHEYLAAQLASTSTGPTPGSIIFYESTDRGEHIRFVKELTAERIEEEFIEGLGMRKRWKVRSRNNHWLDCSYNAMAAAHISEISPLKQTIQINPQASPVVPAEREATEIPYLIADR